jgi:tight adherence protein C
MEMLIRLQTMLQGLIADPRMAQLSFVVLIGLAVFALMVAVLLIYLGLSNPVRRRAQELEPGYSSAGGAGREQTPSAGARLLRFVEPMGVRLMPTDEKAKSNATTRLRHAGVRAPGALKTFYGVKLALILLLPTIAMLVGPVLRLPLGTIMLLALSAGIAGYLLPTYWLEKTIKHRTTSLRRGLPDTLDLLVVCTEAGLGLSASIQRVAQDLEISQPDLSDELKMFGMQTRAGMDTRTALKDLEERSGVEDIRGLVTSLIQSMQFGTSIASTLRIYASELRDKRTQEAEERAAKVSTKMLFPLVFCVLPSFFVVALGPPLLGAMEALAGR